MPKPMLSLPIRFSPLIYTSLPGSGFGLQANQSIPLAVQEIFLEKIVNRHWDAYSPPEPGSCAIYLYQISLEAHLFGWLYCDGQDDFGRTHVPYFLAYYYAGTLNFQQMETILTYLQFGPETMPTSMEPILAPNLWNYEPSRPGVRIPVAVREAMAVENMMEKLLDLYVPDKKIFGWKLETSSTKPSVELPALKKRLDRRRNTDQRMRILLLVFGISITATAAIASRLFLFKAPAVPLVTPHPTSTVQTTNNPELTTVESQKPRKHRKLRNKRR